MSDLPLELVCPKCGIEVQPIKAVNSWFCPHCARQFTAEEVERGQRRAESGDGNTNSEPPEQ